MVNKDFEVNRRFSKVCSNLLSYVESVWTVSDASINVFHVKQTRLSVCMTLLFPYFVAEPIDRFHCHVKKKKKLETVQWKKPRKRYVVKD